MVNQGRPSPGPPDFPLTVSFVRSEWRGDGQTDGVMVDGRVSQAISGLWMHLL